MVPQRLLLLLGILFCHVQDAAPKGCNKTIRTTRTVRSPRVTNSVKGKPLHCTYKFLKYGDSDKVFELNFKAFQVGNPHVNATSCDRGYVQIIDSGLRTQTSGYFCGKLRRSRTFISETDSVTLVFHVDNYTKQAYFKAQSSVLPKRLAQERHKELAVANPGVPIPNTYCDRIFANCVGFCDVMSPGYPGFYPRNVTCRYYIVFNESESRVALGGQYYDNFDVWGGPGHDAHCGSKYCTAQKITNVCPYDYIQVFESMRAGGAKIGRFCGKGHLPRIVSRGNEVMVEFVSSTAGTMLNDGFYLSVGSESRRHNKLGREMVRGECHWVFRSEETLQGHLHSPRHWYPPGTRCTYKFFGRRHERIWLHFTSFDATRDDGSECGDRLTLYDSSEPDRRSVQGVYCGRLEPNETALSTGNTYFVEFISKAGSYDGSQFEYSALFMFIDTNVSGTPVPDTVCDEIFSSENVTKGTFDFLQNRLRLRQRRVKCKFKFVGRPTEQVRLTFSDIRFDPSKHCIGSEKLKCTDAEMTDPPLDRMMVFDAQGMMVECLCGSTFLPLEFTSAESYLEVRLNLLNVHYLAYRDIDIYLFKGKYEFLQLGCGRGYLSGSQGSLVYPSVQQRMVDTIHCRWTIEVSAKRYVLLKFQYLYLQGNCSTDRIRAFVAWQKEPYDEICDSHRRFEILPPSWDRVEGLGRNWHKIVVELVASSPDTHFKLMWSEVTRTKHVDIVTEKVVDNKACEYVCSDDRTCISRSLVCNGVINCPETNFTGNPLDEGLDACPRMDVVLVWLVAIVGVSFFVMFFTLLIVCVRKGKLTQSATLVPK